MPNQIYMHHVRTTQQEHIKLASRYKHLTLTSKTKVIQLMRCIQNLFIYRTVFAGSNSFLISEKKKLYMYISSIIFL